MSAAESPALPAPRAAPREVAGLWGRHLLSFAFPLNALLFLWTGPHPWYVAILFMAPLVAAHRLDAAGFTETRQPLPGLPEPLFDSLVYALAAAQLWVVFETLRLFQHQGPFSFDMLMVFMVVGSASGFSIITAHELIHRRGRWQQRLGRLLLSTVLYEHFFTEHVRGHHARVGTPEDPATARFGEAYEPFFRRTVPAQFRSAWRLEKHRLGDAEMGALDPRMLRNRIVHGLLVELGWIVSALVLFGPVSLLAFVLQAVAAIRLLEAVNYFEHWGLRRRGKVVRPRDSWDTHSWFTYYSLIGLTRHADHHARASRPYQRLRIHPEAPLLPAGYVAVVDMVMGRNPDYQLAATAELARRGLGPFAREVDGAPGPPVSEADARTVLRQAQQAEARRQPPRGAQLRWRRLGAATRGALVAASIVGVSAVGAWWQTGGDPLGLGGRLLLHAFILATFVTVLRTRLALAPRLGENASWLVAFSAILASGAVTSLWL